MSNVEALRAIAWILLATVGVLAVAPTNRRLRSVVPASMDRLTIIVPLAVLFALSYPNDRRTVAICCMIGAVASEILPVISLRRDPKINDALLKAFGALSGVLIGAVILQIVS